MNLTEKELAIKLLEAKIERMTGKKIVYQEAKKELTKVEKLKKVVTEMVAKNEISEQELQEIFGKFMGSKWDQATAEKSYNQTYAKLAPKLAQQFGTDVATLKNALIKFMMDNGGLAVTGGNTPNAQWDAASKSFVRKSGKASMSSPFSEDKK